VPRLAKEDDDGQGYRKNSLSLPPLFCSEIEVVLASDKTFFYQSQQGKYTRQQACNALAPCTTTTSAYIYPAPKKKRMGKSAWRGDHMKRSDDPTFFLQQTLSVITHLAQ